MTHGKRGVTFPILPRPLLPPPPLQQLLFCGTSMRSEGFHPCGEHRAFIDFSEPGTLDTYWSRTCDSQRNAFHPRYLLDRHRIHNLQIEADEADESGSSWDINTKPYKTKNVSTMERLWMVPQCLHLPFSFSMCASEVQTNEKTQRCFQCESLQPNMLNRWLEWVRNPAGHVTSAIPPIGPETRYWRHLQLWGSTRLATHLPLQP